MNFSQSETVHKILLRDFQQNKAPIVDLISAKSEDPFKILVATILSARSRDETTAKVLDKLFLSVDSPADLRRLSEKELEELIYPVGFYRNKARHLKKLGFVLKEKFQDQVPRDMEELLQLPGTGRKTANLVQIMAFDMDAMCVDIHVHRISNRLGLIQTKTPLETEMALRDKLPRQLWKTWNSVLVSFGQRICQPVSPWCSQCPIRSYCEQINVKQSR